MPPLPLSLSLSLRYECTLLYVSPPGLGMPDGVRAAVAAGAATDRVAADLSEAAQTADVLYVTRVQKERFASQEDYLKAKGSYTVDPACVVPLFVYFFSSSIATVRFRALASHFSVPLSFSTLCLAGRWPAPSRRAW